MTPVEFGLWRIDGSTLTTIPPEAFDSESRLESLLAGDLSLLGLDLLVIGRQVTTPYGGRIDLLAIDGEGDLHLLELKRDRTPREVVAQALDYASWVKDLSHEDITSMFSEYVQGSLEGAFESHFGVALPEALNQNHRIIIVASALDPASERIVTYLSESFGVPVNAVFFRYLRDDGREYLARTWLVDPKEVEVRSGNRSGGKKTREPWNGQDYYVAFGDPERRSWEDARRYGFVSGGGGAWYSRTLNNLEPGNRVFVHVPERGYVGVGHVVDRVAPVTDFTVSSKGKTIPITDAPLANSNILNGADDKELVEYFVRVEWERTLALEDAIWEAGMFANQNTVCKMRNQFTLERLVARFGLSS